VDPKARILNGGFTPKHWIKDKPQLHEALFMKMIYQCQPVPFDIAATHPYTAPHTETTNLQTTRKLEKLASFVRDPVVAAGEARKPLWFTEFGVPTEGASMNEQRAADYFVVMMVHSLSLDYFGRAFWYNLRDLGVNPKDREDHFGLLRFDSSPKPAYFAYYNLNRLLEGTHFVKRRNVGGASIYTFDKPGQRVLVVWADGNEPVQVTLPVETSHLQAFDVTGRSADLQADHGQLSVQVTPHPSFITFSRSKD
jgi:hypothetical protein